MQLNFPANACDVTDELRYDVLLWIILSYFPGDNELIWWGNYSFMNLHNQGTNSGNVLFLEILDNCCPLGDNPTQPMMN